MEMTSLRQRRELKNLISYFHYNKICPDFDKLADMYNGNARSILLSLERLGEIKVNNGKITDIIGLNL